MNSQQQDITSLVPVGPSGQLLDPLSFLLFLFTLPLRIITVFVNPQGAMVDRSVTVLPRVPFPELPLAEQSSPAPTIIEAPSYSVQSAESPPASQPAATYENEERCEIVWNEDGLPKEIIIHRRATRT